MAIETQARPSTALPDAGMPERRPWTREEFERAGDLGLFAPEERLELIAGDVIRKMTPQKTPHATAISLVTEELRRILPPGHHLRPQLPLALGGDSLPEPDVAIVSGAVRDYERAHPTTASLVVEVADTTLRFDRTMKAGLYARAGIREYWVVNLQDGVLEVLREPAAMSEQPLGHHYRQVMCLTRDDMVTSLLVPQPGIQVADLLPKSLPVEPGR